MAGKSFRGFLALTVLLTMALSIVPNTGYAQTSSEPTSVASVMAEEMTNVNGTLFFRVSNGDERGLWKSDGTIEGTMQLTTTLPEELTNVNGTLFFRSRELPRHPGRLWKSDGTPEGTLKISDVTPQELTNVKGTLFFRDNAHDLWKSDGTSEGTVRIARFRQLEELTNVNGILFFRHYGTTEDELWRSDGTFEGTFWLASVYYPNKLMDVDGTLFFFGNVDELWKSDGTNEGTVKLADNIHPADELTDVNGTLFFRGNYTELWKSDGTPLGTVRLQPGISPKELINVNGTLFFHGYRNALWKSDGTPEGTVRISSVDPKELTNVNGTLFFRSARNALWKSDGTPEGTVPISEDLVDPEELTNVNGTLFFYAKDWPNTGLWKSDGTPEGTKKLIDVLPEDLTPANGTLFFRVSNGDQRGLWAQSTATDLTLTKTGPWDPIAVGDSLTYLLRVTNNGGFVATDVALTDTLPADVNFDTVSPSQGRCNGTEIITCNLGSLISNATATVVIRVTPTTPGLIINLANVASNQGDTDSSNNRAVDSTIVVEERNADLSVTKLASFDVVTVGTSLTYFIDLINQGPFSANGVILNDQLPAEVTFVSADPSQGSCEEADDTVTCALGTINNGDRVSVSIVVTPNTTGVITNTASVTAEEIDPDTSDNIASVRTTLTSEPTIDLEVTMSDSPDPLILETGSLTYDINVTNNGPFAATGVILSDSLPEDVSFVSANPSQGSCGEADGNVTCNLGAISNGRSAHVTIVVRPNATGKIYNYAYVSSNEIDNVSRNNRSVARTRIAPEVDLVADTLEVTQGIQNLNNDVRQVAGKSTFVRFYAHSRMGGPQTTTARLRVQSGNRVIELSPIDPTYTIEVQPLSVRDREILTHTFLFRLPYQWTQEGSTALTAEVNPSGPDAGRPEADPVETNYLNNSVSTTVSFENVPTVALILYGVSYGQAGSQFIVDQIHRQRLLEWLRHAYPVKYSGLRVWQRSYHHGDNRPTCRQVNSSLNSKRIWDKKHSAGPFNIWPYARYYGMVDDGGGFTRGLSPVPGFVACGPTGTPRPGNWDWDTDGSYGDWYGGHELAHTFGRRHVQGDVPPVPGACGDEESGGEIDSSYPHPNGFISTAATGNTAYFGFNIHTRDIYDSNWRDVMTYCDNQWISDYTYEGLMDYFQQNLVPGATNLLPLDQTDRLIVTGSIDPETNQAELQPLFVIPNAGELEPRVPGDYAIVLRDALGTELARYPFTPDPAGRSSLNQTGRSADYLLISELVPYMTGTMQLDIEGPDGVLTSVNAGASTPTVTLTAPNGGETLMGETVTVSWTADDPDGDPLYFDVQYSADNGASWEMVAQNITENSVEIDNINIISRTQGRFRVWVSDGIHTASDESDSPITVPNHVPTVEIMEPATAVTIITNETLGLSADAYDIDTGSMLESQIQWFSSLDGLLGNGPQLSISNLSVGTHVITVEANDGQGGVATDTVEVTVVSSQLPRKILAYPDFISFDPANGVVSSLLFIDNQNGPQGITWNAVASEPWVQLSATSGTTLDGITVTFIDTGLPEGTHEATITLTSPDVPGESTTVPVHVIVQPRTAIELSSLTAQGGADHITLRWQTAAEIDNEGFNVWRAEAADGPYTRLNASLIPAQGDPDTGASYEYVDSDVVKGVTYYYKLEDVDLHGASTFHGSISATAGPIHRLYLPSIMK